MVKVQLSEFSTNVFENLAYKIAEENGGRIASSYLLPYMAVSLALVDHCLEQMVDGVAILLHREENRKIFEFPALIGQSSQPPRVLASSHCVACAVDLTPQEGQAICPGCRGKLQAELNDMADTTGWPAQAVYEHEILYLASQLEPPLKAATLAAHSRYTLRRMRDKLNRLVEEGRAWRETDDSTRDPTYCFFPMVYPKARYQRNLQIIMRHPASLAEETETRLVKIFFSLGILVLGLFILAVFHVPYPLLVLAFLILAPTIALKIWTYRRPVPDV